MSKIICIFLFTTKAQRHKEKLLKNRVLKAFVPWCLCGKIIALTASSLEEERTVVLDSGCDDYLRKPFREGEVFELLSKHLGVRFVYAEDHQAAKSEEQAAEQNMVTAEALAALPAEWLGHLKQGAEDVDVELLSSVIGQIRGHDAALADALTRLAEDFEYDEILTVIQQIEHGGDAAKQHR